MAIPVPGRIVEALRRSTVQIQSGNTREQGSGSGVVLPDTQVVTNAHVLRDKQAIVESWEGRRLTARLVRIDRRRDLALLHVPALDAPPVVLGDSDQLRVGSPVVAVGNPLGFIGAVSSGIVHAIGPAVELGGLSWIQADIRLAPGNSGGLLADFQGHMIGINTMVLGNGLALAVPSRAVQRFLTRPQDGRSLGAVVRPVRVSRNELGMMILEVIAGGAAEQASLLPGDILVGGNGTRFRFVDDLAAAIERAPDLLLRLEFYRGVQNALRQVTVKLLPEQVATAA
ncbi:MAG TPA: trypsin-like peptidase domain-containing protein [Bryobacteraceae bacterium]|nr:trypsin-like peptidase domain-containing protein [Bryobacteraceae bacterium]